MAPGGFVGARPARCGHALHAPSDVHVHGPRHQSVFPRCARDRAEGPPEQEHGRTLQAAGDRTRLPDPAASRRPRPRPSRLGGVPATNHSCSVPTGGTVRKTQCLSQGTSVSPLEGHTSSYQLCVLRWEAWLLNFQRSGLRLASGEHGSRTFVRRERVLPRLPGHSGSGRLRSSGIQVVAESQSSEIQAVWR